LFNKYLTRAKNFYNLIIVFAVPKKIKEVNLMKKSDFPKTLGIGIIYRCPFCGNDLHPDFVYGGYKCDHCHKSWTIEE